MKTLKEDLKEIVKTQDSIKEKGKKAEQLEKKLKAKDAEIQSAKKTGDLKKVNQLNADKKLLEN